MSELAAPNDALAQVIASSRAGAEQVEKGHFRLDWERALDKIKRFQLTDPHRYVLEIVQAAVASDATRIDVTTDSDDVIFEFDGAPFGLTELTRLFDFLFSQQLELVRFKELALGVNAALALAPKFIVVESGDGKVAHRLRLSKHTDLRVEELRGDEVLSGTRVHVRERTSWKVVANAFRTTAETQLLAECCAFSPIPIVVDGTDVCRPFDAPARSRLVFDSAGVRGEICLPRRPSTTSRLEICMSGVRVVSFTSSERKWVGPVGVVGWVDSPMLSRNASHSDVHHDDEFRRTLAAVRGTVRALLRQWLEETFARRDAAAEPRRDGSAVHSYMRSAAAMLMPGCNRRDLPAPLAALVEVPDLVELALEGKSSSLRPFWDTYMAGEKIAMASESYALERRDLPANMLPGKAPRWLFEQLFGNRLEWVDETLAELANGVHNRRQREANPREAVVADDDVLVKVSVADEKLGIRGEIGLGRAHAGPLASMAWLAERLNLADVDRAPDKHGIQTIFLRDGVFLAYERVNANLLSGVAVVDCAAFVANEAWDDIVHDDTFKRAGSLLRAAIPALLRELSEVTAELPPPQVLMGQGVWSAAGDGAADALPSWPSDALSIRARRHVDVLLKKHRKLKRDQAPWLWQWPLLHRLDGSAASFASLTDGSEEVRYVIEKPWGEGAPEGMVVLNISRAQQKALGRYLSNARAGEALVHKWRQRQTAQAALIAERDHNLAMAAARRQSAQLDPSVHVVIVDLELGQGQGQVGIPFALTGDSWIRYLIDGVPLPDAAFDSRIALHAVVDSAEIEADARFEKVKDRRSTAAVEQAVAGALPRLIDEFVASEAAASTAGRDLVWAFLGSLQLGRGDPFKQLSDRLLDYALVDTVAHGALSLRAVRAEAEAHDKSFLSTRMAAFRQLGERAIVICSKRRTNVLKRLVDARAKDYTATLEAELDALQRMEQPRQLPLLSEPMALLGEITGPGISGQVGVALALGTIVPSYEGRWLDLLRDGVMLERVPLSIDELPLSAVVDCLRFTPTRGWDGVARNEVFAEVMAAVRAAAEALVLEACGVVARGASSGRHLRVVVRMLRNLAGRRLRGQPKLAVVDGDAVGAALLAARIWTSAGEGFLSLGEIGAHWQRAGVVWTVEEQRGHVAADHVIVAFAAGDSAEPLIDIFGDAVADGSKTLRRDEAAYQRQQSAPLLAVELESVGARVIGVIDIDYRDDAAGIAIVGQAALYRDYQQADPGTLHQSIAIDGRLLGKKTVASPLRGLVHLDCSGLRTNRDWTGLADSGQRDLIDRLVIAALWDAVRKVRAELGELVAGETAHEHIRVMFVEALAAQAAAKDADAELLDQLMAAPLFRTVQGRAVSAAALLENEGELLAVSKEVGEGNPGDGRLIVRAGAAGLAALGSVLGGVLRRHDDEWSAELAGQRRRRAMPRVVPSLGREVVAQVYFQEGSTSGLAGLLRPPTGGYDDSADGESVIRLHVDYRQVVDRQCDWHPAVEIWLNDDNLQPAPGFDEIIDDGAYTRALAVAARQLRELLVRAGEHCHREESGGLRLRICNYVLTRFDKLMVEREEAATSAAARLLELPLWRCLTSAGPRLANTLQLDAACAAAALALVGGDARGRPAADDKLVVSVGDDERHWLTRRWGKLPDYGERLERDEAARRFTSRKAVAVVDLAAVDAQGDLLCKRTLTTPGCVGEVGIYSQPGRTLAVEIFSQRRRLATRELEIGVGAAVAVECEKLTVNGRHSDVVTDRACKDFLAAMRGEVHAALIELAGGLAELRRGRRGAAERVLLAALARRQRDSRASKPLPAAVVEAIENAPLFVDVEGRALSIAAIRELSGGEEVAAIDGATARLGVALADRLVLVIESTEVWRDIVELLPVVRCDADYGKAIAGRERMERAPSSFELSGRRTLASATVTGLLAGEVGLSVPPQPGWLALFAHGHLVEKRGFADLFGLVGRLGGDISTDLGFSETRISKAQLESIAEIYQQRLVAAVDLAADFSGSRRSREWAALCTYVMLYLEVAVARVADRLGQRCERIRAGDKDLPAPLLVAAQLPVFRRNDKEWVDLRSVIGGENPTIVVAAERVRKADTGAATMLIGDVDRMATLFTKLLPRRAVVDYLVWREAREQDEEKAAARREQQAEAAVRRLSSALKSALRGALDRRAGSKRTLSLISKLRFAELGRGDLITIHADERLTLNTSHRAWRAAGRVAAAGGDAVTHLGGAVLADLVRSDCDLVSASELVAMVEHLARKAGAR